MAKNVDQLIAEILQKGSSPAPTPRRETRRERDKAKSRGQNAAIVTTVVVCAPLVIFGILAGVAGASGSVKSKPRVEEGITPPAPETQPHPPPAPQPPVKRTPATHTVSLQELRRQQELLGGQWERDPYNAKILRDLAKVSRRLGDDKVVRDAERALHSLRTHR